MTNAHLQFIKHMNSFSLATIRSHSHWEQNTFQTKVFSVTVHCKTLHWRSVVWVCIVPSITCNIAFQNISILMLNSLLNELNTVNIFSIHGSRLWVSLFAHGWLSSKYSNWFHLYLQQLKTPRQNTPLARPPMLLCHWERHLFPISSRSCMAAHVLFLCLCIRFVNNSHIWVQNSGKLVSSLKKHEEELNDWK